MNLIGFNGGMGVGKSTAIEVLKEMGETPHLVKFAQPLYDMQEFIYQRISSVYTRPEDFVKDRKLLQWIGTDWGRDTIRRTIWVDLWRAEVMRVGEAHPGELIVCDDVRFDNEAELVQLMGGIVVKIICDAAAARITTANGIKGHASEAGVSPLLLDYVIDNNSTLDDYKDSLRTLHAEVTAGWRSE